MLNLLVRTKTAMTDLPFPSTRSQLSSPLPDLLPLLTPQHSLQTRLEIELELELDHQLDPSFRYSIQIQKNLPKSTSILTMLTESTSPSISSHCRGTVPPNLSLYPRLKLGYG